MTNNQIIRNEAARLDPATLHAIATAHHTPDEIAAIPFLLLLSPRCRAVFAVCRRGQILHLTAYRCSGKG